MGLSITNVTLRVSGWRAGLARDHRKQAEDGKFINLPQEKTQ
jgi:hypothetical protein